MRLFSMYFFQYNIFILFVDVYILFEIINFSLISLIIRQLRHSLNVFALPVYFCNYLVFNAFGLSV